MANSTMIRRLVALLIVGVMGLAVAACGGDSTSADGKDKSGNVAAKSSDGGGEKDKPATQSPGGEELLDGFTTVPGSKIEDKPEGTAGNWTVTLTVDGDGRMVRESFRSSLVSAGWTIDGGDEGRDGTAMTHSLTGSNSNGSKFSLQVTQNEGKVGTADIKVSS